MAFCILCGGFTKKKIGHTPSDKVRNLNFVNFGHGSQGLRIELNGTAETGGRWRGGQGNQCSVEFNIVCRWHPTISARDQEWMEEIVRAVFGKRKLDELTMKDFQAAFANVLAGVDPDPSKRTPAGCVSRYQSRRGPPNPGTPIRRTKRGRDGRFSDHDLATILQEATESPAGAFHARGTPGALRVIEMFGIMQARQWGVCPMNEFRQFLLGLDSTVQNVRGMEFRCEHCGYVSSFEMVLENGTKNRGSPSIWPYR
ncbi:heme peroxidase [Mycena olivaceomarginata]|nr:heme peroxidase [Mycena olivaceomarginata]